MVSILTRPEERVLHLELPPHTRIVAAAFQSSPALKSGCYVLDDLEQHRVSWPFQSSPALKSGCYSSRLITR